MCACYSCNREVEAEGPGAQRQDGLLGPCLKMNELINLKTKKTVGDLNVFSKPLTDYKLKFGNNNMH